MASIVYSFSDTLLTLTIANKASELATVLKTRLTELVTGDTIPTPQHRCGLEKDSWLSYLWLVKILRDNAPEGGGFYSVHDDKLSFFDKYKICENKEVLGSMSIIIKAIEKGLDIALKQNFPLLTATQVRKYGTGKYEVAKFEPSWAAITMALDNQPSDFKSILESRGITPQKLTVPEGVVFSRDPSACQVTLDDSDPDAQGSGEEEEEDDFFNGLSPGQHSTHDPISHTRIMFIMKTQGATMAAARETIIEEIVSDYFKDEERLGKFLARHKEPSPILPAPEENKVLSEILGGVKSIIEKLDQNARISIAPGPQVFSAPSELKDQVNVLVDLRESATPQKANVGSTDSDDEEDWNMNF